MGTIRMHVYFSGRVQGVGFRFTACRLARPLGLTGWVKNLWDGRVEMEVQGDELAISQMIEQIGSGWCVSIEHMDCEEIPLEEEREFRVRY